MNIKKYLTAAIMVIILAALDQFTKYLIIENVELHKEIPVIGNAVVITHIHNSGAAWGKFSGMIPVLLVITIIISAAICYIYHNIVDENKYLPIRVCLVLIMGGAIGNMIDRIRFKYVTDFIYFKIINFPVFNVADIFVTVSVFVLIFLFILKYKSEDLDRILGENKKSQKEKREDISEDKSEEENTK